MTQEATYKVEPHERAQVREVLDLFRHSGVRYTETRKWWLGDTNFTVSGPAEALERIAASIERIRYDTWLGRW